VVHGSYGAACQDMGAALISKNARVCMSSAGLNTLTHMHQNFTIDGLTPRSSITVTAARVKGTTATVDGTDIHVSGTTLTSLMVAHSTGVKPGQFSISFLLSRIRGGWYVTNMNMSL
jgi:hypothetical protein